MKNKRFYMSDMPEYVKEFFYQQLYTQDIHKIEHIEDGFMGHRKHESYLIGPGPNVEVHVIISEAIITKITISWLEQPPKGENYRYRLKKDVLSNLLLDAQLEKKWFLYDMYIAAKNKYEGKPYFNPYKDTPDKLIPNNMEKFVRLLDTKKTDIFPANMPIEERVAALNELKSVLYKHIAPYRTK